MPKIVVRHKIYGRIYIISNKKNSKLYVGQTTSRNSRIRFYAHASRLGTANSAIRFAMRKYGSDCFSIKDVYLAFTKDGLDRAEIELISCLNTLSPKGYNLREGGANGKHSMATRKKISARQVGRVVSAETRAKISATLIGVPHSDEWFRKNTGLKRSEQFCAGLSKRHKGVPKSDAHRAALSAAQHRFLERKRIEQGTP